ncbi:hypothetical protein DACRYDRAFT_23660 [Dacryopinax primogenitus]|uniref:Uncharacterized protein n=1 Tax=Dacryopinax primogenitus (strain DJM 731) TaxID=1858805 RepID=M5G150_DACPD|nr:uncharacterized protein DACRYDRAFT_23660 [Dacryopinax primogenitus]EJT99551.1 hypothetical protein DACRYDRAFT_23660 [Dacryopinax primogenitus]
MANPSATQKVSINIGHSFPVPQVFLPQINHALIQLETELGMATHYPTFAAPFYYLREREAQDGVNRAYEHLVQARAVERDVERGIRALRGGPSMSHGSYGYGYAANHPGPNYPPPPPTWPPSHSTYPPPLQHDNSQNALGGNMIHIEQHQNANDFDCMAEMKKWLNFLSFGKLCGVPV